MLGPDIPAGAIASMTVQLAGLPLLVVAFLFGGRGLLATLALGAAAAAGLLYKLAYHPAPDATGMEGIAFIVLPFMLAVTGLLSLGVYLLLAGLRWLPRQRRRRRR
jgi:hypothetical protein